MYTAAELQILPIHIRHSLVLCVFIVYRKLARVLLTFLLESASSFDFFQNVSIIFHEIKDCGGVYGKFIVLFELNL